YYIWRKNRKYITSYMHSYYLDHTTKVLNKQLSIKQAKKEFIARGFKPSFKKQNKSAAQVGSTINQYIYPKNYKHGIMGEKYKVDVYKAQPLLGIRGYTKCIIPKY